MSKQVKIKLEKNENYTITNKLDAMLIFSESSKKDSKGRIDVSIILPNEKDLGGVEVSNAINVATAIAIKFKSDPTFAPNLLQWLADFIQSQAAEEDLASLN